MRQGGAPGNLSPRPLSLGRLYLFATLSAATIRTVHLGLAWREPAPFLEPTIVYQPVNKLVTPAARYYAIPRGRSSGAL